MPKEQFFTRVDNILDEFKACPPAKGVERVIIPGEIEAEREKISKEQGIELSDSIIQELHCVGETYGVKAEF